MNETVFNYSNNLNASLNESILWDIVNDHFLSSSDGYDSATLVLVALYVPVFLLGILGNGFLTVIILTRQQLRNVTNLFLCSLAVADLAGEIFIVIASFSFPCFEKIFCVDYSQAIKLNITNFCDVLELCNLEFEPRHDKTNKMSVRPAKTQISLGIRSV